MPAQKNKYDVAVSFMWPHDYAAKKVKADKKIAWIHTDYTIANMDFENEFTMASINKILNPEMETMFLTASDKYTFVSSSNVKVI